MLHVNKLSHYEKKVIGDSGSSCFVVYGGSELGD